MNVCTWNTKLVPSIVGIAEFPNEDFAINQLIHVYLHMGQDSERNMVCSDHGIQDSNLQGYRAIDVVAFIEFFTPTYSDIDLTNQEYQVPDYILI